MNCPRMQFVRTALRSFYSLDDVEAIHDDLNNKGVESVAGPQDHPDWGIRSAHIRDPDGNLIELHSEIDPSKWSEGLQEAYRKQQEE